MCNLRSALFAGFLAFASAGTALAGQLDATVIGTAPSVSLSVGGSEPVASFSVTLKNTSATSAMNIARLVGTTSVADGEPAVYKSVDGAICTTSNGGTTVDCNVGGLLPNQEKTFRVSFKSPTSGSQIVFSWDAVFDNGAPPGGSNGDAGTASMDLAQPDNNQVVSDIPPNQPVTFFTGIGTVATPGDPWVTILKAPSTSVGAVATVVEEVLLSQCSPDLLDCRTTTMTIPTTFGTPGGRPLSQFLEVTILRDASTIAKGAKIDTARLYYKHDVNSPGLGDEIVACTADLTLPKAGVPCEDRSQRIAFPKKGTPKAPVAAGFESDWKFIIYMHDNGRITN